MVIPWGEILVWPYNLVMLCWETIPGRILMVTISGWSLAGMLVGTTYVTLNYLVALAVIYLLGVFLIYLGTKFQQFLFVFGAMLITGGFWAVAGRLAWWFIFRV